MAFFDNFDIGDAINIGGNILSGVLGSRGAEKAGETAADAARYGAELQYGLGQEALDLQRQLFGYQTAQDAYNRQQAERALGLQAGAYGDQYDLTQRTFNIMGNQLGYGNALRQNAMGNLQQFANLGLGSLSGLAAMTGGTGAGITGPSAFNVQAPSPIAPLGPSQVRYTPQDTEALFRSILDNPAFQLPTTGEDEDDTTEADRTIAADLADWFLRTQGGAPTEAVGETGGEGLGGNAPAGLSGPTGFDPGTARQFGIEPSPNVSRNTALSILGLLSPTAALAVSQLPEDEINEYLGSWFGYDMPSIFTGVDRDMVGLGDFGGQAGGISGFGGVGEVGSMGEGLGGYGDSGLAGIGGMGDLGDPMGGDLGLL